uniref:Elongator complex protein 5 n=1 Tax=Ciona savignyi TaxID=51511 RepID=H2YX73_CIOSA
MLLKLVNQAEKPGLILIEDSLKVSGTRLFQAFLANQSKDTTVHLFLFENNPKDFLTDLECDNVIIYDFYTDPLGWNCGKIMLPTFSFSKHLHDLTDQNVVAIDSVGMYLINHSASLLCRDLHKLQMNQTIKQCVVLVHCDEILPEVKTSLQYLSNVFLSLTNEEMEVDKSKSKTALVRKWRENILICKTTFKKFNGKLIFSDEEIK